MPSTLFLFVRRAAVTLACVAPFGWAVAQNATPPAPIAAEALPSQDQDSARRNQKIENIHVEDSGAKVDEVRYGGRTQSIAVQPKANVPGYEVRPENGARPGEASNGNGTGPRVWNVLKF
ncbi:hypothetical protein [Variovorax sp. PAMC 28711]|uniref:hypothetical protein n=1 Tax=Variovorax sp. PAMC 28711 TaxID=1795631 RepID=UPI00078D22EE|nr:hypothetical protein [Variovorax sp. PAMC 28711]AMM25626.1 hypothetical protein AX767_15620 [Variovorax sp. PAMC 28711]